MCSNGYSPRCKTGEEDAIRIKRTYDPPAGGDGRRILVERLWPRGMKKEALDADAWMKEIAPSTLAQELVNSVK
jgi:uncharacterized protein YeaO (DUF488 family)